MGIELMANRKIFCLPSLEHSARMLTLSPTSMNNYYSFMLPPSLVSSPVRGHILCSFLQKEDTKLHQHLSSTLGNENPSNFITVSPGYSVYRKTTLI